ncbi:MAG: signal peptidase II [Nitrospirae bacterium]|nr:signal peptidase II [Nitrospirota bacterium]
MLRSDSQVRKPLIIFLISFTVIFFDYLTKKIIVESVSPFESINVLPFLRIVHVENKGAAFGLFANLGNKIFIGISIIAITLIIIYTLKFVRGKEIYSLPLILGGAIGNLIDRVRLGNVIDFIDVYVGKWHWPAFNVADSALTIGIILFIWSNLRSGELKKSG